MTKMTSTKKKRIDLVKFGIQKLGYGNEKTCRKHFVDKFNEYRGLPTTNIVGSIQELILFSFHSSKKELKEWSYQQLKNILVVEDIDREVVENEVMYKDEFIEEIIAE